MDRKYYTNRIDGLISTEGYYVEVNQNSLPVMDRKADSIRLEISKLFNDNLEKTVPLKETQSLKSTSP